MSSSHLYKYKNLYEYRRNDNKCKHYKSYRRYSSAAQQNNNNNNCENNNNNNNGHFTTYASCATGNTNTSSDENEKAILSSSKRKEKPTTNQNRRRHSLIIGGGFVGLSTALHLQRLDGGRKVTVVEASDLIGGEASASYGNAGTMAVYANVPVNSPSIIKKLPQLLGLNNNNDNAPLSIIFPNWYLMKMIPWMILFGWNCRPSAVEHTSKSLGALLSHAESGWELAFQQANIDINDGKMGKYYALSSNNDNDVPWRIQKGYLILQPTRNDMEASKYATNYLRKKYVPNLQAEQLSCEEVLQLEPHLNPKCCQGGAWYFPNGWFLNDPGALLRALADGITKRNNDDGGVRGTIRTSTKVVRIIPIIQQQEQHQQQQQQTQHNNLKKDDNNAVVRVRAILEDGNHIDADDIIIAAGAHSKHLVSDSMEEFCPLETERGYSITFDNNNNDDDIINNESATITKSSSSSSSSSLLTRAVCDPTSGWIATPMAGGLRIAGKVELGGIHLKPTKERFDQLENEARSNIVFMLPDEEDNDDLNLSRSRRKKRRRNESKDWLGFRPTMPDALPVICSSKKLPNNVFYAFGHQHVGWTLAGITGQIVAERLVNNVQQQDEEEENKDKDKDKEEQKKGEEEQTTTTTTTTTKHIDLSPYRLDRFFF